jgi:uncharacterized protein
MIRSVVLIGFSCFILAAAEGCKRSNQGFLVGWHRYYGWDAELYFDDSAVVKLCKAIEKNDLKKMKSLIDSGANVNAVGKDGMTPLLWAFPNVQLERFKLLLENGADPSVVTESDFKTGGRIPSGLTVAHLTAMMEKPDHFFAVVKAGVSPDLSVIYRNHHTTLFGPILRGAKHRTIEQPEERVRRLLALKPSQDTLNRSVEHAITVESLEIALMIFEAGAELENPYYEFGNPLHYIAGILEMESTRKFKSQSLPKLMKWVDAQPVDVQRARKDWNRWRTLGPFERKSEIADRAKQENRKVHNRD